MFAGLETSLWNFCFAVALDRGLLFSLRKKSGFLQFLSVGSGDVSERLQRITTHESLEVVYPVFLCELVFDF